MAKPNYAFAKRQRDLAKKQKKEEKKLRKSIPGAGEAGGQPESGAVDAADQAEGGEDQAGGQPNQTAGAAAGG